MQNIVVMTDLDGSLLDHYSYSFSPAIPALAKLQSLNIPLILNSSKTTSEMLPIRASLQNEDPFVVENGSTLFVPKRQSNKDVFECITYGLTRKHILNALKTIQLEHQFKFQSFSTFSIEQVIEETGLNAEQAQHALARHYTEPLLWQDSAENLKYLESLLSPLGIKLTQGGRFVHLSGNADKSSCMHWLRDYYENSDLTKPIIIALGDSENDLPMLAAADYAVLIKSPVKQALAFEHNKLIRTELHGPYGWNKVIIDLLAELHIHGERHG